jgi:hypothetical protein
LNHIFDSQMNNTYIRIKKQGGTRKSNHPNYKLKKFFDMVKNTKSNPISKRNGVKKVFFINYQSITNLTLTAMPF